MASLRLTVEIVVRLLLAMCIGGCIGWERAKNHHPAGIRTHMLVTIGAAVVMLLGSQTVGVFAGTANSDPARLGAQVISGIGFLGAGTIMKEGRSIRGLTTAATLWVVACLGLAIGAGQYTISLAGFAVSMIALRMFKLPRFEVSFLCGTDNDSFQKVCDALMLQKANICNFSTRAVNMEQIRVSFELYLGWNQKGISASEVVKEISRMPDISHIEIDTL